MNKKTVYAHLISLFFHPVLLAIITPFLVVYRYTNNSMYAAKWMVFSFVFMVGGLVAIIVLFRKKHFLFDIDISTREHRPLFYAIACLISIIYFIVSILFKGLFFPLSIVSLGIILALVVFEIGNFYLKVSGHTGVLSAFTITIGVLYGMTPFLFLLCCIPLMGWSRVYLKKHTKKEVIVGMILGSMVTLITLGIGLSLQQYVTQCRLLVGGT